MIGSDVEATAAAVEMDRGGSHQGGEQTCGPEREGMTAAPKCGLPTEVTVGAVAVHRPDPHSGKVVVPGEETGRCTPGAAGVEVQARRERSAETTSGRTISQQGLATTCKDPRAEAKAEGRGRVLVRRMSPYERGRRGNALRGGARRLPEADNTGLRAKGLSALGGPAQSCEVRTQSRSWPRRGARDEPGDEPLMGGVYASQRLNLVVMREGRQGRARVANRTREIRPSGMTEGACGNVGHGGNVNPPRNRKSGAGNPPP